MDTRQFSTEFDVLFNSVTSNQGPGFNDYEKSVFLTKAEIQIIQEILHQFGYDTTPKRQVDFSTITKWETLRAVEGDVPKFDPRSIVYELPEDLLYSLNEQLSLNNYESLDYSNSKDDVYYSVVPISFVEYDRLMSKPYKYPPKYKAWKLINITKTIEGDKKYIEIIGKFDKTPTYRMRYVRMPKPIILEDLTPYDVNLYGLTSVTECELPEELHHEILERAVTLAKIAWGGTTATQVAMAQDKQ